MDATAAGLLETIETDAYWLSIRLHQICGRFDDLLEIEHEWIPALCARL